jgi:hypothetical protein
MLKIEKLAEEETTVLQLVGRITAQHPDELGTLIADAKPSVNLDLGEVTLLDVAVIRFLGDQERKAWNWPTVRATSESGFRGSKRQAQRGGSETELMQSEEG